MNRQDIENARATIKAKYDDLIATISEYPEIIYMIQLDVRTENNSSSPGYVFADEDSNNWEHSWC